MITGGNVFLLLEGDRPCTMSLTSNRLENQEARTPGGATKMWMIVDAEESSSPR